jgi:hypothetical protein
VEQIIGAAVCARPSVGFQSAPGGTAANRGGDLAGQSFIANTTEAS